MSRLACAFLRFAFLALFAFSSSLFAPAQEFTVTIVTVPAVNAKPAVGTDWARTVQIPGSAAQTQGLRDLGPVSPNTVLGLQMALRRSRQQQNALDAYLRSGQMAASISPAEFAGRFGLAASDLGALRGWLSHQGFEIISVDNGRLAINFRGTAAQVDEAFHASIHEYLGAEGSRNMANASPVEVPRVIAPVVAGITGLNTLGPFAAQGFDGPVKDFALGNEAATAVEAATGSSPAAVRLTGATLHDSSFTASKSALTLHDENTLLNIRLGGEDTPMSGELTIADEQRGVVAQIKDITACPAYNNGNGRSCTIAFAPGEIGVYNLHALYSGDDHYRAAEQKLVISHAGTMVSSQVATITPLAYVPTGTASGTVSWIISWANPNTQPTGTVLFSSKNNANIGTITLPASGNTSSGGSCTASTGTCTYACTYNSTNQADQTVSCTLSNTNFNGLLSADTGAVPIKAAYSGDGNYAATAATTLTEAYYGTNTVNEPAPTLSVSPSPLVFTASTYGQTRSEATFNVTFTGQTSIGNYLASAAFFELTGGNQLGSLINNASITPNAGGTGNGNCNKSFGPCVLPAFTVPAVVTPGNYTLTLTYSGDYDASASGSSFYPSATLSTFTLQVMQAPPTLTMTTPTAGAPQSQTYGTTTAFNVTATLGWTGVGAPPSSSDINFTSTAAGTFATVTCGAITTGGSGNSQTNSQTCTAAFTPAGTSTVGSYNFSVSFAGDTNYLSTATSTISGDYTITSATTTSVMVTPRGTGANQENETYGSLAAFGVTGDLSWPGSGAAPTAADITFTSTAAGAFSGQSCSLTSGGSPYGCTATFTPTTTDMVGNYGINIMFSGDSNYTSSVSAQTQNYSINQATPTFGTMSFLPAATETYGTAQAITISDTLAYTGAVAPTGAVKYNLNGTNHTASCTGSSSPLTCTATVVAGVIEALPPAAYAVAATYTADTDYAGTTGTSGTFTITQQAPTSTMITPRGAGANQEVETYGALAAFSVSGQLAWTGSGAAPTAANISFVSAAGGTFTSLSCSLTGGGSPYACTATFTPTATDAAGNYGINLNFAADTNYSLAASAQTQNYSINQQTPTLSMTTPTGGTPESDTYGQLVAFTVTGKVAFTGNGNAPTAADISFTSMAAGSFSGLSCSLTSGGSPYVCTATFTPAATDTPGNYGINLSFAGDTNYASNASVQTKNYQISAQAPTPLFISPRDGTPVSQAYGALSAFTASGRISWTGNGAAPAMANISFTSTAAGTFTNQNCTAGTLNYTCTVTFTPTTTDVVGSYAINIAFATDGNYSATHSVQAANYVITQATTSVALVAATTQGGATACGSTATGVTSCVLTATMSPAISGAIVTFTDTATGQTLGTAATTSGVAALTATATTTGIAAGLNNFTATVTGTTNYTSATSAAGPLAYYQGILFSTVGAHNFSGLITNYPGFANVEGTEDGTKLGPYGVSIYNFTASAKTLPLSLTNSASGAFSYVNNCASSIPAGGVCSISFYYAPPSGDGCTPGVSCTTDGAGYPQGTFESAPWTVMVPNGVLTGIGDQSFDRSGAASPSGVLEGKAILIAGTLTVSPLTAGFGSIALNSTSNTITITVTNPNSAAVPFTYTGPATTNFSANNTCTSPLGAGASCSIYLTMATANVGSFSDSLSVTPAGNTAISVAMSGSVAAASSGLTLSSTAHNFGNVSTNPSPAPVFGLSITNNAAVAATISFSNTAGAGYTTTTNCGASLAAGASCTYSFTFDPTTAGASTDSLVITSSVPILPGGTGSGPYMDTVTVTGTGTASTQLTATSVSHNFGTLAIGTSGGNYGVEMSNNTGSTVALSFSGLTNTSEAFSLVGNNCPAMLATNTNCEMVFSFTPNTSGTVTAAYPISTGGVTLFSGGLAVSPQQITLTGTGQ